MTRKIQKGLTITVSMFSIITLVILFAGSLTAKKARVQFESAETIKLNNSQALYEKIKRFSDSVEMIKYHYSMEYLYDDTTSEKYFGVVYKKRNFNIDSNGSQFTFNDNDRFFAINHKVSLAVYSNLKEVKAEALKIKSQDKLGDSLDIKFRALNSVDFSDSVMRFLIAKDRSYENDSKIVIDVEFIDDSPLLSYYLMFDKRRMMADSMIVRLVQMEEFDAPESDLNNDEDVAYYRDLTASESYVTFKAYMFSKGDFHVQNAVDKYIAVSGKKIKLLGHNNYNLTVLK